jgi:soluble lytic murein transglycosylase
VQNGASTQYARARIVVEIFTHPRLITPPMKRFLWTLIAVLAVAAVGAAALKVGLSPDPRYTAREWLNGSRYWQYDPLIHQVALKNNVDPLLVKAIVWRESGFHPDKVGTRGERGLMQVTEIAATDWAKAEKVETFVPTDLFDPKTNLDVGVWYLRRALDRWKEKDNPVPFALAEYNAGKSRVDRWISETQRGDQTTAKEMVNQMDFASTKRYVEDITARYQFYRERGH